MPGAGDARRGECRGAQRLWRGAGQTVWWFVGRGADTERVSARVVGGDVPVGHGAGVVRCRDQGRHLARARRPDERGGEGRLRHLAVRGRNSQIVNWKGDDSLGTATGVPEEVGDVPSTVPWTWKGTATSSADSLSISLNWDKAKKALTITGTDANGEPLVIEAKRS